MISGEKSTLVNKVSSYGLAGFWILVFNVVQLGSSWGIIKYLPHLTVSVVLYQKFSPGKTVTNPEL